MANIDPIRRAEIGREKRARTRAQLVAAASALFARQAVESVTVDDVVREAGVAKGTFYVHFKDLRELTAAVADELVKAIDDLLQPIRLSIDDPALRIAYGCSCFIDRALADPGWAGVAARMAAPAATVGEVARRRLLEDIKRHVKSLPHGERHKRRTRSGGRGRHHAPGVRCHCRGSLVVAPSRGCDRARFSGRSVSTRGR